MMDARPLEKLPCGHWMSENEPNAIINTDTRRFKHFSMDAGAYKNTPPTTSDAKPIPPQKNYK